jgi:hypothetical protein
MGIGVSRYAGGERVGFPGSSNRGSIVGLIMSQDSIIPVANNAKSQNDLIERWFSRQPLRIDVDIARSLEALERQVMKVERPPNNKKVYGHAGSPLRHESPGLA